MKIYLILLILTSAMGNEENDTTIVAYDCKDTSNPTLTISLLNENKCTRESSNSTIKQKEIQLIQIKTHEKINYIQCHLTFLITITHCATWMLDTNYILKTYTYSKHMSHSECAQIHHTRIYQDPTYGHVTIHIKDNEGEISKTIVGVLGDGCGGAIFTSHRGDTYENVAVHAHVKINIDKSSTDLNLKENTLTFFNSIKCIYSSGSCFLAIGGDTFWNHIHSTGTCTKETMLVIFQGYVIKRIDTDNNTTKITYSLIDKSAEKQFLIEDAGKTVLCSTTKATITQSKDIYLIEKTDEGFFYTYNNEYSIKNLDTNLYHSMKLSLAYKNLGEQLEDLYKQIKFEQCNANSKTIANLLALSKLDPVNFGYIAFNKPGLYTIVSGEVLRIIKCNPQIATIRKTEKCYQEIPVKTNDENKFVTPRSRLIIDFGQEVECGKKTSPVFHINGKWFYKNKNKMIESQNPIKMDISTDIRKWVFSDTLDLVNKGIYTKEELSKYKDQTNTPIRTQIEHHNFIKHYISNMNNHPYEFEEEAHSFFTKTKHYITNNYGETIKTFITTMGNRCSFGIGIIVLCKLTSHVIKTLFSINIISSIRTINTILRNLMKTLKKPPTDIEGGGRN